MIRTEKKNGKQISFFSVFIKALSRTMSEFPEAHAFRTGKRQVLSFRDINIAVTIERDVDGVKVPLVLLIKETQKKSAEEIEQEIRTARNKDVRSDEDYVLNKRNSSFSISLFYRLPGFIRMIIWKFILNNPFRRNREMGNAMVTSLGVAGYPSAWVLPRTIHNLSLSIGSVSVKPWVVDGNIEKRDILHLTVSLDHDVIDGAPAARFIRSLSARLEMRHKESII